MSELRKLLAEATPGPWGAWINDYEKGTMFVTDDVDNDGGLFLEASPADATLIVYLRNHAEDIAALIEAAQADHYPSRIAADACRCGYLLTHCQVYVALAPFGNADRVPGRLPAQDE